MLNFLSDVYYKYRYGIRIYRNVLSEEERLELLRNSSEYLDDKGPSVPGLQTVAVLHTLLNFKNHLTLCKLLKLVGFTNIRQCWSNYSDSYQSETVWHTHSSRLTSIYYMENPEGLGTLFRVNKKEFKIDVPTNTLMVIPGNIEHNAPSNVTKPRQCFVVDTD